MSYLFLSFFTISTPIMLIPASFSKSAIQVGYRIPAFFLLLNVDNPKAKNTRFNPAQNIQKADFYFAITLEIGQIGI